MTRSTRNSKGEENSVEKKSNQSPERTRRSRQSPIEDEVEKSKETSINISQRTRSRTVTSAPRSAQQYSTPKSAEKDCESTPKRLTKSASSRKRKTISSLKSPGDSGKNDSEEGTPVRLRRVKRVAWIADEDSSEEIESNKNKPHSQSRSSTEKSASASKEGSRLDFPPPRTDICKLCPPGTHDFDDIFRHYAIAHSALYVSATNYRRDTPALEEVLKYTGKLVCQYCSRAFTKSGFGLTLHESRCLNNPKNNALGVFGSPKSAESDSMLVNGYSLSQLEEMHSKSGALKCNTCGNEYRSPVQYFVKHVKRCEKKSAGTDELTGLPDNPIPGSCIFCPVDQPPVNDMFKHYANDHTVLFKLEQPGWDRSPDALDILLRSFGKLKCHYCRRKFTGSGLSLINHENKCPVRAMFLETIKSENEEVTNENGEFSYARLAQVKQRDGFLRCSKCDSDYRMTVMSFLKHVESCNGIARQSFPSSRIEALMDGEYCGDGPFACHVCTIPRSFDSAALMQEHYASKHASIYAPSWPDGLKTQKVRDLIIRKFGSISCPNCGATYKLTPSFLYHEKICSAPTDSQTMDPTFISEIIDKKVDSPVACSLCSHPFVLAPNNVQDHYMNQHSVIYYEQPDGRDSLATNEVLEFLLQKLGSLRCDKCAEHYRCPVWYFIRHQEICGKTVPENQSDSEPEVDTSKESPSKSRRKAASKAIEKIGQISDDFETLNVGANDKDKDFQEINESGSSAFIEDDSLVNSEENDSLAGEVSCSVARVSNALLAAKNRQFFHFLKNLRDVECIQLLKEIMKGLVTDCRKNFPKDQYMPLPSRLAKLKAEPANLIEEKFEFPKFEGTYPEIRIDTDPPNKTDKFSGLEGKLIQLKDDKNEAVLFVGGRAYAMDFAPLQQDACNISSLWLAVSAASDFDPETRLTTYHPSVIQVWRCEIDQTQQLFSSTPRLAYQIAIELGPCLALHFCPINPPAENNHEKHIGHLAVGGSGQNLVSIMALPTDDAVKIEVIRPKICLNLSIYSNENFSLLENGSRRTICMDWCPDGSVLVAALSDSTVAIWNLDSSSPLFDQDGLATTLLASRVFQAHSQPITTIRISSLCKSAIITFAVDGTLSVFNTTNGILLSSLISPYSSHLTLLPGISIPVLVNNPWFVYRRVPVTTPKKDKASSSNEKCQNVVSTLSAVDLYGESPVSDIWPFQPIYNTEGSISSISTVRYLVPKGEGKNPPLALGIVTGSTSGNVRLYSTGICLLKIRRRGSKNPVADDILVQQSRNIKESVIELVTKKNTKQNKTVLNPLDAQICPPKNAVNLVAAIQIPSSRKNKPAVIVASSLQCGIIRLSLSHLATVNECLIMLKKP